MRKIANFNVRRRDWGWRRALHWEVMSGLAWLGIRVHYVNIGADMQQIIGEEKPEVSPEYDTRMIGFDEIVSYVDRVPGLSRENLETAFGRGDVCAANFYHGELVGFSFCSYTRARVTDQLDVLVPEGFRYGYKGWTHPDHRRANLQLMRSYVRRIANPADRDKRSLEYIETHNYASLLHRYRHPVSRKIRAGFAGWITIGGRQIPFSTRHARWVGFLFVRKGDLRRRQYIL
jgi:hypothetical protein